MPHSAASALASSIIKQAVNDYMNAIIQDDQVMISDCEKFFLDDDDWFGWLTNDSVSGERLIKTVKANTAKFIKACECHQPEPYGDKKAAEEASFTCPCCGTEGVVVTYDRRNSIFPKVVRYTCSTCHITLRMQWHGDVLPRELNCSSCEQCLGTAAGWFCMKHDKPVKRLPKNCDDWERKKREEAD